MYKDESGGNEGPSCCAKSCCAKTSSEEKAGESTSDPEPAQPAEVDYNEYAGSFKIYAVMA